jgi:hypothetical protein
MPKAKYFRSASECAGGQFVDSMLLPALAVARGTHVISDIPN